MFSSLNKGEKLQLELALQIGIAAASPEHLAHLLSKHGLTGLSASELISHFVGLYDDEDKDLFAKRFRELLDQNWNDIVSGLNQWFTGQLLCHDPVTFEGALYFFAVKGFFGLEPSMVPHILEQLKKMGIKTPGS